MRRLPFPHELDLVAVLSDEALAIETTLRRTGDTPVPVAFGFHPYLRLPGLARRDWLVGLPVTSRMVLDDRKLPTGASEPVRMAPGPLGDRTFDDAFDGLAERVEFTVQGAGRRVAVRFGWGLPLPPGSTRRGAEFISFEPMTALINPFASDRTHRAEPVAAYRARFEIAVADVAPTSSRLFSDVSARKKPLFARETVSPADLAVDVRGRGRMTWHSGRSRPPPRRRAPRSRCGTAGRPPWRHPSQHPYQPGPEEQGQPPDVALPAMCAAACALDSLRTCPQRP